MPNTRRTLSRERLNELGREELTAILTDRTGRFNSQWDAEMVADLRALVVRICHG